MTKLLDNRKSNKKATPDLPYEPLSEKKKQLYSFI